MKIFVLLLILTTNLYAQSSASPVSTSTFELPSISWEKLRSKTRINYFNFATGPNLARLDNNETSDQGTQNREPISMYHSLNIRFNTVGRTDLLIVPRMVTPMGDRDDLRDSQDHHSIMMDDWDFGVYQTIVKTQTFDYSQAVTYRAPFSVKSRDNDRIDRFFVWSNQVNWALPYHFRLLHWTTLTYYDFDETSTIERYRFLNRTLLNYSISDRWVSQIGYELDLQHLNPHDSSSRKHRAMNFTKRYHSYITAGIGYNPAPQWTVLPYLRALDERNIRNETLALGFMIFGRVM